MASTLEVSRSREPISFRDAPISFRMSITV